MPAKAKSQLLQPLVRKLSYRSQLDAGDRNAILALACSLRAINRNHSIVRERSRPTHISVLLSGCAARTKLTGRGRRQLVGAHFAGDLVDAQNMFLDVADCGVQALEASQVAQVPLEEMVKLCAERPRVSRAIWFETMVEASILREWTLNVGRRDAATRLAHLLCELALRSEVAGESHHDGYELPWTQEDLADATGMTSVHVSRTIKALRARGVVGAAKWGGTRIGDWRSLADAADFDSGYLYLREEEPALEPR